MRVLIIIPAYNEAESIEQVIDNLISNYSAYDYVIINDGSTDDTQRICESRGFNILNLPINLGIGGAVQTGYRYALKNGYDVAVQMDGDGQHDPKYLDSMLSMIESGEADVIIGSRFIDKEGFQSSASRRAGINILSILALILTGVRLHDITSGYRMVSRSLIEVYSDDYPSDYPEPEAMVMAAIHGYRIKEAPVIMKERAGGSSSITLKKSIYYMIKVSMAMIIKRLSLGFRRVKK